MNGDLKIFGEQCCDVHCIHIQGKICTYNGYMFMYFLGAGYESTWRPETPNKAGYL